MTVARGVWSGRRRGRKLRREAWTRESTYQDKETRELSVEEVLHQVYWDEGSEREWKVGWTEDLGRVVTSLVTGLRGRIL